MRFVIQRVKEASVTVYEEEVSAAAVARECAAQPSGAAVSDTEAGAVAQPAGAAVSDTEAGAVAQPAGGAIGKGFMVLIGACQSDTKEIADKMVRKMLGLRIFEDENGKTNLSLESVGGSLLLVSQFTLYADCRKGNRPSFLDAGDPAHAEELYDYIVEQCRAAGYEVGTGVFGTQMDVSLVNDGPFTIILDSDRL